MSQHRGVIQSPNYPNNYPDNSNCTWTIQASAGRVIHLQFTALSIQGTAGSCDNDYVEVGYTNSSATFTSLKSLYYL